MFSASPLQGERERADDSRYGRIARTLVSLFTVLLCSSAVAAGPIINVSPDSLYQELNVGNTAVRTITISNSGDSTLEFEIEFSLSDPMSAVSPYREILPQPVDASTYRGQYEAYFNQNMERKHSSTAGPAAEMPPSKLYEALSSLSDTLILYFDDMENGANGWIHFSTHTSGDDFWSQTNQRSFSGVTSWNAAQHPGTGSEALVSPSIDLAGQDEAMLSFMHWYNFDDCDNPSFTPDGGLLQISVDDGATWTQIFPVGGYPYILNGGCGPLEGIEVYAHDGGNGSLFIPALFDLTPYAGQQIRLMFEAAWDCGNCANNEGWYIDDVTVYSENPVNWLFTATPSGLVPPGGSVDVDLLFDATSIYGGAYAADVDITSNDLTTSLVAIPTVLVATGIPDISVDPLAATFPLTPIGSSITDTIVISSLGTDSLLITSVTSNNVAFTVPPVTLRIGVNRNYHLPITFSPAASGSFAAVLTIASNDPDQPTIGVSLIGEGATPPAIAIVPDSLDEILLSGDTAIRELTISNDGEYPLDWSLQVSEVSGQFSSYLLTPPGGGNATSDDTGEPLPSGRSSSIAAELADLTGVRIAFESYSSSASIASYPTMTADLVSRGATVGDLIVPYTSSELDTLDIVWFADIYNLWSPGTLVLPLAQFVLSGGAVVLEGDNFETQIAFNELLDSLNAAIQFVGTGAATGYSTKIFPHPTTQDIDSLYFNSPISYLDLLSSDAILLAESRDSIPMIAVQQIGAGYIFAISDEILMGNYPSYADNQLFGNQMVDFLARATRWLVPQTRQGTVAGGQSEVIDVLFSARNMFAGDYFADLIFGSTDPVTLQLTIPAHLEVVGAPNIEISQSVLQFDSLLIGLSQTLSLAISNTGTDTLHVSSISPGLPDYTVDSVSLIVPPQYSKSIAVNFAPLASGDLSTTLEIISDDSTMPVVTVDLLGVALDPPVIGVTPDSLHQSLFVEDSAIQYLTITNSGLSDLLVSIETIVTQQPSKSAEPPMDMGYYADESRSKPEGDISLPEGLTNKGRMMVSALALGDTLSSYDFFGQAVTGAVWAQGYLVMCDYSQNLLLVYDTTSQTIVQSATIHASPFGIAFDGVYYWVADPVGNVYAYDLAGVQYGSFSAPTPTFTALTWDGQYFFCAAAFSSPTTFYRLTNTGQVVETIPGGNLRVHDLEWVDGHLHEGGRLWACEDNLLHHLRVDADSVRLLQTGSIPPLGGSYSLAHDGTDLMWIPFGGVRVYRVDDGIIERKWLRTDLASATIPAGQSLPIAVTFDAAALLGGNYSGRIDVVSNDPANALISVPATMEVIGIPDIEIVSPSLDFGQIYLGYDSTLDLEVRNAGTGVLHVTDIASDNMHFTLLTTSFTLLPFEVQSIAVTFVPSVAGIANGTLSLTSNDPNESPLDLPMTGEGLIPPEITLRPDLIRDTLNSGDSTVRQLIIGNAGGSDLNWSTSAHASQEKTSYTLVFDTNLASADFDPGIPVPPDYTPGIPRTNDVTADLADLSGVVIWFDIAHGQCGVSCYNTLVSDLVARGATVADFFGPYGAGALSGVDVLIIDEMLSNSWSSAELAVLADWADLGGGLLLHRDQYATSFNPVLTAVGADIQFVDLSPGSGIVTTIYPHATTTDIDTLYFGSPLASLEVIGSHGGALAENFSGYIVAGYHESASLRVVAISDEVIIDGAIIDWDNQLFANQVIDWLAGASAWLSSDPTAGMVLAGDSAIIDVHLNATGLFTGDYSSLLNLHSNDPVVSDTVVPVSLHVIGVPNIAFSSDTLNFNTVYIGQTDSTTIEIHNVGTDTLLVSSISATPADYVPAVTGPISINPLSYHALTVYFSPQVDEQRDGLLTVASNDPDDPSVAIVLTGLGAYPPVLSVTPDSLEESLFTGQTSSRTILVENTGGSALRWDLRLRDVTDTSLQLFTLSLPDPSSTSPDYIENTNDTLPDPVFRATAIQAELATLNGLRILYDRSHGQQSTLGWSTLFTDLVSRGAQFTQSFDPITPELLDDYDLFYSTDMTSSYTTPEVEALADWVLAGHGLFLEGDDNTSISAWQSVLSVANSGILLTTSNGCSGYTQNIGAHATTRDISEIYLTSNWAHVLAVVSPAGVLVTDICGITNTAYSEVGNGRIVVTMDETFSNGRMGVSDNQLFANQIIDWLAYADVTWLSVVPRSGFVSAGEIDTLTAYFDATDLTGCDYFAEVIFASNDPSIPQYALPVHLDIDLVLACHFPNDTSVAVCPGLELCLPLSQDTLFHSLVTCSVLSGPGTISAGNWCYVPTQDETAVVTVECTDSCGNVCQGTFTIDIQVADTEPPVLTCPPNMTVQCIDEIPPGDPDFCRAFLFGTSALSNRLFGIDPADQNWEFVGALFGTSVVALATHPQTGEMYLGRADGQSGLYRVDTSDARTYFVGNSGLPAGSEYAGMDFRSDGILFAVMNIGGGSGSGGSHLVTIDHTTGSFLQIFGPIVESGSHASMRGFDAIAFDDNGELWGAINVRSANAGALYKINPTTAVASFVGWFTNSTTPGAPGGRIWGLQFACDGNLYGGMDDGFLVTLDTSNAYYTRQFLATHGDKLDALAGYSLNRIQVSDNCDPDPVVSFVGDASDGQTCPETILRTFRAEDATGLTSECVQTITVMDTIPPVLQAFSGSYFQCVPEEVCRPITVTDNCDNAPVLSLLAGPGSLVNGTWCYTPAASEVVQVTVSGLDQCGNQSTTAFQVTFDLNDPPMCTAPQDTSFFFCTPEQICLPYSASDPDSNIALCEVVSGPGSLSNGEWCYLPTIDENASVAIRCTDSCGVFYEDTFTVFIDINNKPVVTCPPDTQLAFGQFLSIPITATDADLETHPGEGLTYYLGAGSANFATINSATGRVALQPQGGDICLDTVIVIVKDQCNSKDTCLFEVCVTNEPPTLSCPTDTLRYYWGQTIIDSVLGNDPDSGPSPLVYSVVSFNGPGTPMIDPASGAFSWATVEDNAYIGTFDMCVKVTDGAAICDPCSPSNADTCCIVITVIPSISLAIEKTHESLQGRTETVSIYLDSTIQPGNPMGGFDFLIEYDASALNFLGADAGSMLDECGWEYFQYRFGAAGNCGAGPCPSGKLRIVAYADMNNGLAHPTCFVSALTGELAVLSFYVTNDRTLECSYVPIKWCWYDCGDTTISSVSGDTLFISRHIYEFEDEGGLSSIEDDTVSFPSNFGANTSCELLIGDGKPDPHRLLDFWNGGIDIACAESLDARGDINLNEIAYEIADAVLFANYFVYGLSVFTINLEGQIAATDVNADGLALSVADLVYLIRVVTGDALPFPKVGGTLSSVRGSMRHLSDGRLVVEDGLSVGAAYLVVEDQVLPELLATHMTMRYAYDGDNTRILVYSMEGEAFNGDFLRVDAKVLSVEMATSEGNPIEVAQLPLTFRLGQNHPNPFNPTTDISFDIPEPSLVRIDVFNISGQRLVTLVDAEMEAGQHTIVWDARDYASGMYLYRLTAGNHVSTRKMILLK